MKRCGFKKLISGILISCMIVSMIPATGVAAAEQPSEKYPYVVFAGGDGNSLDFGKSGLTVNGNIHSNGTLTTNGNYANINGDCSAVGGVVKGQNSVNIRNSVANPVKESTIIINKKIQETYFTSNCDKYETAYSKNDVNVNLNKSVFAKEAIILTGNVSLNCCIGSDTDITLNGGTLNSNNTVIYSENGNVIINNDNATVNGLIYAPNGKVTVNSQNFQVNGAIIAKEIVVNSSNVNINYNDNVAKFIGNTSEEKIDSDNDGIPDVYEKELGTDPFKADTDGDELTDYQEIMLTNTDPLKTDTDGNKITDSNEDLDQDGLSNLVECKLGTDPLQEDSDYDGLKDGEEVNKYNTDPLKYDTDGDTISDGDEVQLGLNPTMIDTDGNGVLDKDEKFNQTFKHSIDNTTSAISEVDVSFKGNGNINSTTTVDSIMKTDKMCSGVAGLVGDPFEIKTTSKFDTATISFKINQAQLKNISLDNLAILWYDEANNIFKIINSKVDKENYIVSAQVTHFSKYMVIDKTKWFEAWSRNLNYSSNPYESKSYNTVLALDCSGSMYDSDPIINQDYSVEIAPGQCKTIAYNTCGRIQASENYIQTLESNDKAAVMAFESSPHFLCDMTSDKSNLKASLQNIYSDGGTEFDSAINTAVAKLNEYNDSTDKMVIFLSDGWSDVSTTTLDLAKKSNVKIVTVALGTSCNDDLLKYIATSTGGEFYKAITSAELTDLFAKIGYGKDVDTKDSDGDGLYDIFETTGMRVDDSTIVCTDPYNPDTDGDGIKDGDEIIPEYRTMAGAGIPSDVLSKTTGFFFHMKSDPNSKDGDGDGYADSKDPRPLVCDVTKYSLSKSDFLSIHDENNKYYGGDQDWFGDKDNKTWYNRIINNGGCGTVAACDNLAYLELTNPHFSGITGINNINNITKDEYMSYISRMANSRVKPLPMFDQLSQGTGTWGVWPSNFISGMQRRNPNIKINTYRFSKIDSFLTMREWLRATNAIASSLNHDIPVPLFISFGGKVDFYQHGIDKISENAVSTHWVTATELKIDRITDKTTVTIATWGGKRDMDLFDFMTHAGLLGGVYALDIR